MANVAGDIMMPPPDKESCLLSKSDPNKDQSFEVDGRGINAAPPGDVKEEVSASINVRGVVAVCGGMLIYLVFGTFHCWGNWNSYLPKNMKNFDGSYDPANSKRVDALQILPWTQVFQTLAMPVGVPLGDCIGPGLATLISGLLCFTGPFLASFSTTLGAFAILYAGVLGSGMGLGFLAPMVCGFKHFPDSKGMVSGLILGAFGMGGFVFNKLGSDLFNPDGLAADRATLLYPDTVTDEFGSSLRKLAVIYLVIALVAAPLIRLPQKASGPAAATTESFTIVEAMQTRTFWLMWFAIAANAQGTLYVSSKWKIIALDFPTLQDDRVLAMVGALGTLSNGLTRPLWGMLYDRIGFRICLSVIASVQAMIMFIFPSLASSPFLYTCGVVLSFTCLAGNVVIAPAEAYKVFGNASVFAMLSPAFTFAGILGPLIATGVADILSPQADGTPNTEETAFKYLSFMSLIAVVLVQFHGHPRPVPRAVLEPQVSA